jgi:hypothetical protein
MLQGMPVPQLYTLNTTSKINQHPLNLTVHMKLYFQRRTLCWLCKGSLARKQNVTGLHSAPQSIAQKPLGRVTTVTAAFGT